MRKFKYIFPSITILLFIVSVVSYSLTGPRLLNILNEYNTFIFVLYYSFMLVSIYSLMKLNKIYIQKARVLYRVFYLLFLLLVLLIGASIWRKSYYNLVEQTYLHIHISIIVEIILFSLFTVLGLSIQLRIIDLVNKQLIG